MDTTKTTAHSTGQPKQPSYLSQVKSELEERLKGPVEHRGIDGLWEFMRNKIIQSYWNGVRDGNRGVKPKQPSYKGDRSSPR